ncbi:hypothetical protein CFRS1_v009851 [Colletotrichum fructicola]|nr:hypothetical protein CFRS1_v009851 [Colletotrichum fructicola]
MCMCLDLQGEFGVDGGWDVRCSVQQRRERKRTYLVGWMDGVPRSSPMQYITFIISQTQHPTKSSITNITPPLHDDKS